MSYRYEGVLRKPGLLPGRKTKVWCVLDDKELIFYRENRRHSCIGSEELSDITSIHRLEGTDSSDFQINTETKTTLYTAEDAVACEKWVFHIKAALEALGPQHSSGEIKTRDKTAIQIQRSPENSVHNLMQLWQRPSKETGRSLRHVEKPKVQNTRPSHGRQFGSFVPAKTQSGIHAAETVRETVTDKESKVVSSSQSNIVGDEVKERGKRTDSGYETIVPEKRDSDHKSDSETKEAGEPENKNQEAVKTPETQNDNFLNKTNKERDRKANESQEQGSKEEQVREEDKSPKGFPPIENVSRKNIKDSAQEQERETASETNVERSRPKELVSIETKEDGVQQVDISNVVFRRKSRPSASLLLQEQAVGMENGQASGEVFSAVEGSVNREDTNADVFSTKEGSTNGEDIDAIEISPDSGSKKSGQDRQATCDVEVEQKLDNTTAGEEISTKDDTIQSNEDNSRLSMEEQPEEERPVQLRRDSKPAIIVSSAPKTDPELTVSPPSIRLQEDTTTAGSVGEGDFDVNNFEDFLNGLTFDPLPEIAPLKLDDISESISEITEIIQGDSRRKSLRNSKFKCENTDDMISELKTLLNQT